MDLLQQLQGMQGMNGFANMGPKALVEYKAGKMTYDGKMVTPDRRKGLIRVIEDAQGMKQFQWCDADTKNPIDSFYVFPDDAKFEKVKQSKDRVYLLEMKHTLQRYFYWIQEEESDKDAELCKKTHNVLNNIKDADEDKPAENATGASPAGPSMNSQQPPMNSQQQNMMNQFLQQFAQQSQVKKEDLTPTLPNIINQESMLKLLDSEDNEELKKELISQLPEGQQSEEYLRDNLCSPQLREAMSTLSKAILESDQVELILASCGLDTSKIKDSPDGMDALIKAFIEKYSPKKD